MTAGAVLGGRRSLYGRALPRSFYDRDTDVVARELLGAVLEHRTAAGTVAGRIVEVEAYLGPHDPACHSARGWTERTRHLHGPPGTTYVYFIYGMHWCVNAVTGAEGVGSAVLIRAVELLRGQVLARARRGAVNDRQLANGPGKLCQAFGIDRHLDGSRLDRGALRILAGDALPHAEVIATPRVGISKATDWPLRYVAGGGTWHKP